MENSKTIDWILSNKNFFNLSVELVESTTEFFPNLFDLSVSINLNGKLYLGRGTDEEQDIAFLKGFCEAIEHFVAYKLNLQTTNGLAVHSNKEMAIQKSREEIIERDAFLCHHLLNANFLRISNNTTQEFEQKFEKNNYNVRYFGLSSDQNIILAISSVYYFNRPSILFGISCNTNLKTATSHATYELTRQLLFYNFNIEARKNLSLEEFNKIDLINFNHHEQLGLNPTYCETLFNTKNKYINLKYNEIDKLTRFEEISCTSIHSNFPFKIYLATNKNLQNLWVGKTNTKLINTNRLMSILPNYDINLLPHFFN